MRAQLDAVLNAIAPVDLGLESAARAHLDNLTKPRGSLGRLEDLAARLVCIQGGGKPAADPARIYTVAGDHGVAAEGVSLFPQEVTRQMVLNFVGGGAGINVLCGTSGAQLFVVDAGCLGGTFPEHPSLIQGKVAPGTANLALGPAMTQDQCVAALLLGVSLADRAAAEGVRVLGTGDMGIANTTPSTALYCAYLGLEPREITGPGTGLSAQAVARIWREGCIIRARLLDDIEAAYRKRPDLPNLLLDDHIAKAVMELQQDVRHIVRAAVNAGVPIPSFMATVGYLDSFRSSRLPANLIQAQRDCFGSHTYERIDREGTFHTNWGAD